MGETLRSGATVISFFTWPMVIAPWSYAHDDDDHSLEPIADFDYSAVDRSLAGQEEAAEDTATMSEFAAAPLKTL
jgi:hypothetical protein